MFSPLSATIQLTEHLGFEPGVQGQRLS